MTCAQTTGTSAAQILSSRYTSKLLQLLVPIRSVNPLMGTGNYSAISNNMKLVHWSLMGGLLYLVQRRGD